MLSWLCGISSHMDYIECHMVYNGYFLHGDIIGIYFPAYVSICRIHLRLHRKQGNAAQAEG